MASSERPTVEVRDLLPDEVPTAVGLLARGFRDCPVPTVMMGPDPERRQQRLAVTFAALFSIMEGQTPLAAFHGDAMVGVTGVAPPGACQPSLRQLLRYVPSLLTIGPGAMTRVARQSAAWGKLDPKSPHSHLGPLAVSADLKGRGIGSQILGHYCRQLDDARLTGYLETDLEENVRLYQRFGYRVVDERPVLKVPNWFMSREPLDS